MLTVTLDATPESEIWILGSGIWSSGIRLRTDAGPGARTPPESEGCASSACPSVHNTDFYTRRKVYAYMIFTNIGDKYCR